MTNALRRATAAAAAFTALTTAGCSSSHTAAKPAGNTALPTTESTTSASLRPLPPGTSGTPPVSLPAPSTVKTQDPDAVSQAALTIQWTMDTTIDTSQHDAELRSAAFLEPHYLATIKANPPMAAPGARWIEWARHRVYTTVATQPLHDQRPADSPTMARRQWLVTVTPHGRDRWTGRPVSSTVFVTMTRSGTDPWLVSAITVSS
ncbi:hypothetical protein ACIHFE_33715 [Streptomyces sp. NPDC052396]|uniref:hypothetical protein n=1 Tax=Streptomyces sp. NPDC052396 TaxID=3365689 RepID=UPI0037D7782B